MLAGNLHPPGKTSGRATVIGGLNLPRREEMNNQDYCRSFMKDSLSAYEATTGLRVFLPIIR